MAYHRKCKVCGARISLREMPHGGWVAFDVGSDEPHEHGVAGRKSSKAVILKKNTSKIAKINQTLSEDQIVDRQGNIYDLSNLPTYALDLTPFNLRRFFQFAIDNSLRVWIDYQDREDNISSREIHPKSFHGSSFSISSKLNARGTSMSAVVIATLHPISSSSLQGTIGMSFTTSSVEKPTILPIIMPMHKKPTNPGNIDKIFIIIFSIPNYSALL